MLNWCVELYVVDEDGRLENPCGSDWTTIITDLKSLAGVKRRMAKWPPFRKKNRLVVEVKIWSYSDNNKYNRKAWKLAEVLDGGSLINLLHKQDSNWENR